jgi:hypothetical protein
MGLLRFLPTKRFTKKQGIFDELSHVTVGEIIGYRWWGVSKSSESGWILTGLSYLEYR